MRHNSKILMLILFFIAFLFLSDFVIFALNRDSENAILQKKRDNYYDKNFKDTYFSEKPYSRPLFMSSRLNNLAYNPVTLGMNIRESEAVFKPTFLYSCPNHKILDFQTFTSKCEPSEKIKVFESNSSFPENYGSTIIKYPLTEYKTDYKFSPSSEFGYIQCESKKSDLFLRNVYNQSIADYAKSIEKDMKGKYNVEDNYRPLTVIMFIVDSVSRRSFYRNMQETVNFFNESIVNNSSELSKYFVLYDFLGNNAVKDLTRFNMTPFIFGISLQTAIEQEEGRSVDSEEDSEFYINRQKEKAIWAYFKEKGFVTMHLNDVVSDFLPTIIGRSVCTDYQVSNIWTFANQYYGYSDTIENYICVGSKFSHQHSLNYLSQFLENYKGHNKFAYIHIEVAHEFSGTRLSLSDKDIQIFFEKTLQKYTNSTEDLFILFAGDHGRYKTETVSLFGRGERSLPFHFVISNKDFIERNNFHKNLDINSRRMLSRYDWHKTLKHLANSPYTKITTESQEYKEIETEYKSLSLLIERSSRDRICEDLGVEPNYCLADPFEEINPATLTEKNIYLYFLNLIIYTMRNHLLKKISFHCNEIKLGKVLYIGERKYESDNKVKPLNILEVFKLKKNSKAVFMIDSSICNKNLFKNLYIEIFHNFETYEKIKEEGYGKTAIYSIRKIWSLTRLDIIEPGIKKLNKDCCEDGIFYNYNYLYSIKGISCLETCSKSELLCVDYRHLDLFIKFNKEKFSNTKIVGELNSLEIRNSTLFIGKYDMCSKNIVNDFGICHCAQIN
ncbi:hypothetical protein SteCoe_38054 [Stentor coeruleus]|uniref:Uncharacterized protein n=1 Tax=Stentor coeruleus TaxID=5963 RepID=A0A1R2ALW6_9CILI|nr:hypothetical protein SteCoe_38054 [Stentor coeruleus]